MKRSRSPSGVLAPQRASPTLRRLFLSSLERGGGESHISALKKNNNLHSHYGVCVGCGEVGGSLNFIGRAVPSAWVRGLGSVLQAL